jgi:DNA-binding MarR family transcriptional regulator
MPHGSVDNVAKSSYTVSLHDIDWTQTVPRRADISDTDYRALAEFRHHIRRFLRFSEDAARAAGLEPQQHQLLLAIRGLPQGTDPSIGELAERLQLQHHSVVELLNRLEARGLARRERGAPDRRLVLARLTDEGDRVLAELSAAHRAELRSAGPDLVRALNAVIGDLFGGVTPVSHVDQPREDPSA